MRGKTRAAHIAALAVIMSLAMVGVATARPSGDGAGNSANAKACQKGGWQTLSTAAGERFTSESQCTSHTAKGGTLLPSSPPARTLTVLKTGSGGGTVAGAGIDCGTDCAEEYADGTGVTLTAAAATGSTFTGWSGDCSGMTCTLSMTGDRTAVATFDAATPPPLGILDCSPQFLDFGEAVGSDPPQVGVVTCVNSGGSALTVGSPSITGDPSRLFSAAGCASTTLAPAALCQITVTFETPRCVDWSTTGLLQIPHNGANPSPEEVSLAGRVVEDDPGFCIP